jgi:hypothetical protein
MRLASSSVKSILLVPSFGYLRNASGRKDDEEVGGFVEFEVLELFGCWAEDIGVFDEFEKRSVKGGGESGFVFGGEGEGRWKPSWRICGL